MPIVSLKFFPFYIPESLSLATLVYTNSNDFLRVCFALKLFFQILQSCCKSRLKTETNKHYLNIIRPNLSFPFISRATLYSFFLLVAFAVLGHIPNASWAFHPV